MSEQGESAAPTAVRAAQRRLGHSLDRLEQAMRHRLGGKTPGEDARQRALEAAAREAAQAVDKAIGEIRALLSPAEG